MEAFSQKPVFAFYSKILKGKVEYNLIQMSDCIDLLKKQTLTNCKTSEFKPTKVC